MTKCAYCGKELDRNVFCSNSHRVMFHQKKKKIIVGNEKKPEKFEQGKDVIKNKKQARKIVSKMIPNLCKHGYKPELCIYRKCREGK